jgi:pimeloyl-ACP methyl ester carboxylesterase
MFVDMLDSWASKISQLGPEGAVRLNANLERRLESAMPLLQRASEEQLSEDDLVHMVLSENKPCLALSTNGVIIAANDPAASVMGLGEGDRFERDALDAKGWAVYQQFLGMIREAADAGRHCVLKFAMEDGGSLLIDAQAVTFMDTKRTFLLMKGFQLSLTDQARDILRDAFELTGTEIAIVDGLMQGQDAGEIAEARATSVETVRTQIKSIAGGAKTLVEEVENIRLFIDAIGLEDLSIIGQGLASAHAMALSIPIQNRVRCVIGVAGYLPVDLSQMFADMSPWQRAVLHAARFSPKLMKVYNQIGMKMMRRIGPQEFFRRTYSTSPADQAVADDPDSLALLQISYNLLQAQTSLALTTDFQLVMRNWRPVFEKVRTPVVMIHGDERQVLAPSEVEAFCDAHGHMQMLPLPGAGQLIAYSHPEKLAELVLDTLDARY